MMFGQNMAKWRRSVGIQDGMRSAPLERLEKEIKQARTLVHDDEIKAGKAKMSDKPLRVLSRAVERVEEEIMTTLSAHLNEQGWVTTSLIHDEIIIRNSILFLNPEDEIRALERASKLSLRTFEDARGWPPGTLRISTEKL